MLETPYGKQDETAAYKKYLQQPMGVYQYSQLGYVPGLPYKPGGPWYHGAAHRGNPFQWIPGYEGVLDIYFMAAGGSDAGNHIALCVGEYAWNTDQPATDEYVDYTLLPRVCHYLFGDAWPAIVVTTLTNIPNGTLLYTTDPRVVKKGLVEVEAVLTILEQYQDKVGDRVGARESYAAYLEKYRQLRTEVGQRLSELRASAPGQMPEHTKLDLAGAWKFRADREDVGLDEKWYQVDMDESDWQDVAVPDVWESLPALEDYDGVGWYRRTVQVPADWQGHPVKYVLGPVDDWGTIWINGESVGRYKSWYIVRQRNVSNALRCGKSNTIVVRVEDGGGKGGLYESFSLQVGDPVVQGPGALYLE